jgi:hypothetical protein
VEKITLLPIFFVYFRNDNIYPSSPQKLAKDGERFWLDGPPELVGRPDGLGRKQLQNFGPPRDSGNFRISGTNATIVN